MKKRFFTVVLAIGAMAVSGCDPTPEVIKTPIPTPPEPVNDVELVLSVEKSEFAIESSIEFTVSTAVAPKEDISIAVSSNNKEVATVPGSITLKAGTKEIKGHIDGVGGGEATITISAPQGIKVKTGSQVIKVIKPEVELAISAENSVLYLGETLQFSVSTEVAPEEDITVKISSSEKDIATVPATLVLEAGKTSVTGEITPVAKGKTTISISVNNVKIKTEQIDITVEEKSQLVLSITAEQPTVTIGKTVKITVNTPQAAETALSITLSNSNTAATQLAATTLSIAAGANSAETTLKGLAAGESVISFTVTPDTPVSVSSVTVTCGAERNDIHPYNGPLVNPLKTVDGAQSWLGFGFTNRNTGATDSGGIGLWSSNGNWGNTEVGMVFKNCLENYGENFVGTMRNGYGVFTAVEEGTVIDDTLPWVTGGSGRWPAFYTEDGYRVGDGQEVYVVSWTKSGPGNPSRRSWFRVSVSDEGTVTIHDGAICLSDAEFRVGQKQ